MTVLKSFDLKGNKQSFAGWISNLSPCDTPFVSMIGKEGTSQTQYSWQIDELDAPQVVAGFEEGSAAVAQLRKGTEVDYNFTQTLRKVVNISDTVAAVGTHGRDSEVAYQMGKSGKELKRDMEFMCLNNGSGNVGTKLRASKFSGFLGLVASKGHTDPITGATVHKEVSVSDVNSPWFKAADIFDLTYNLYLAGSRANKIMFHPRHAITFSQFMSKNIESPMTYRMFDGVATEFNTKVSILRDPLAQKYDLISNRFMPEDKIYFFNENDWTQMILRQPTVSPLGKKGSSERFLLETEIGLRHRNPQASGILEMNPSSILAEWVSKPTPLTWGVGNEKEAIVRLKVRATGELVPDGTEVKWTSSNPLVIEIADPDGQTVDGQALVLLKPMRTGTSIITASNDEGSVSYLATVGDPLLKLTMSSNLVEKGKTALAIVSMKNADGTPVADGTVINFTADPGHLVNLPEKSDTTKNNTGVAEVEINAANELGVVQIRANSGGVNSNIAKLDIVEKVEALGAVVDRTTIAHGINDSAMLSLFILDASGNKIPNQSISVLTTDQTVIQIHNSPFDTGATGIANVRVTGINVGSSTIVAQYKGQLFEIKMTVCEPDILLAGPDAFVIGTPFNMTATVKRSDGTSVGEGLEIEFVGDPAFAPKVTAETDVNGVATGVYTSMMNSDYEVEAVVGRYKSNSIVIAGPSLMGGVWKEPEVLVRPIDKSINVHM